MSARILVAGVGNIFFRDDGYGCEALRRMGGEPLPSGVRIEDYGIRGTHLAFELMSGYDGAVLIDAVPRGGEPGTLYVIEPDLDAAAGTPDAHTMDLQNVFALMKTLDGKRPRVMIVGCEPASTEEGMGLSPAVERAAANTPALVREVLGKHFTTARAAAGGTNDI